VTILNLSHLDTFEERNLVLSQVCYSIYSWMRKKIDWHGPRLLLYVDEIGGGGKHSFYPEEPHQNASKSPLGLLLRQGRPFGVCLCLSTQNPGDIDHRGLTNCQTWFVGSFLTESDRAKITQGLASVNFLQKNFEEFVKTAESGDFAVKYRGGEMQNFRERWLLTWHKVLTPDDYPLLKRRLRLVETAAQARALLAAGRGPEALKFAEAKVRESDRDPDMLTLYADTAREAGDPAASRKAYEASIAIRPTDTACLRLGTLLHAAGDDAGAAERFRAGIELNPSNESLHMELGRSLEALGDETGAESAYTAATKANPNLDLAWILRGYMLLARRDGKEARNAFQRALDIHPETADARTGGPSRRSRACTSTSANSTTRWPRPRRSSPPTRPTRASTTCSAPRSPRPAAAEAAQAFRAAVKLKSDAHRSWDALAASLLALGDATNALTAAKNAALLSKRAPDPLYPQALALRRLGQPDEERKILDVIIAATPSYLAAWLDLGDHLVRDRALEEAVALFDRASRATWATSASSTARPTRSTSSATTRRPCASSAWCRSSTASTRRCSASRRPCSTRTSATWTRSRRSSRPRRTSPRPRGHGATGAASSSR
jgi:tetratricopeptide (TPR) repeat protein